jgi:hypothetical protein
VPTFTADFTRPELCPAGADLSTFHGCLLRLEDQVRNPGRGAISLRELKETIRISSGRYTQEVRRRAVAGEVTRGNGVE